MNKSESIKALVSALQAAQGTMKNVKKEAENPFFKSKYADLPAVSEACKQPLLDNGLTTMDLPGKDEHGLYVETVLVHLSGEWISCKTYCTPVKNDPQSVGSSITYARRYGLQSIVGLCAEEDDDGNAASQPQSRQQEQRADRMQRTSDRTPQRQAPRNQEPDDL